MGIVLVLLPLSLILAGTGLCAFIWCSRGGQFDDPEGDARRMLIDEERSERNPD